MGQKDLKQKNLEDYNDVFADIYNTLLFGKMAVDENKLEPGATESRYKIRDKDVRSQCRDTLKRYKDASCCIIANFGIENQVTLDGDMVVRVMGYDYGCYRNQIVGKEKKSPVVTIVLNFTDKRWNEPTSIHEYVQVQDWLKDVVQDYKIHVFDIAYLEDDVIDSFQSDFRDVAKFFKGKRLGVDMLEYMKDARALKHQEEVLDLLATFTSDNVYTELVPIFTAKYGKGEIDMCTVAQGLIQRGREEERVNTERERLRAEKERERADELERQLEELKKQLAQA